MRNIRTLIIPGLDGSPEGHWQDWWTTVDPRAILVEQDDWHSPTPNAWEARVASAVIRHPGSLLVAHSLGCSVVARLLRRWKTLRIRGVLMVAPADPALNDRICMFDLNSGPLGVPAVVASSRNDPWMDQERARSLAASWGAVFVDLGLEGHVNVASGHGPWPLGLELHAELAGRAAEVENVGAQLDVRAARNAVTT